MTFEGFGSGGIRFRPQVQLPVVSEFIQKFTFKNGFSLLAPQDFPIAMEGILSAPKGEVARMSFVNGGLILASMESVQVSNQKIDRIYHLRIEYYNDSIHKKDAKESPLQPLQPTIGNVTGNNFTKSRFFGQVAHIKRRNTDYQQNVNILFQAAPEIIQGPFDWTITGGELLNDLPDNVGVTLTCGLGLFTLAFIS